MSLTILSNVVTHPLHFVELLARSNFSFLQGASHPEEMALQCRSLGYTGMALCDLNGLYGVVRAHQAIFSPSQFGYEPHFAQPTDPSDPFRFHVGCELQLKNAGALALLPMNKEGYIHLCQLITLAKSSAPKGFSALTLEAIEQHSEDLIALALPPWEESVLTRLRKIFSDRLYLPVWNDLTWESQIYRQQAYMFEASLGLELFVTQRPFMHSSQRKPLHDVLTCILHGCTLEQAQTRLLTNSERHLMPLAELQQLWQDRLDLIENTNKISQRLNFSLDELTYQYPKVDTPPPLNTTEYLTYLVNQGLKQKFPTGIPGKVQSIVQHELELITELNYEDYFLTIWDICNFAHKQGILCQGRGSAANSIVCYALGLTNVDPTRIQLVFERFISKERNEPPDIDVDFESQRREEVIQYIYQKYGLQHTGMVCTVICYRSRMAMREVAKAFSVDLKTIDRMRKYMGREGLTRLYEFYEGDNPFGIPPKMFQSILDLTSDLISFPRHLGIHTGGFVIALRPLTECVPIEKATMPKRYVVQWNKDDLGALKMMKIDVLGLGMLSALQKNFSLLAKHKGQHLKLYNIPQDDPATYQMIQKAETIGVFQIESRAQMSLLPRFKPRNFYDLVIEVAIVRPGPINGGMIHPFLKRRNGLEKVHYPHPDLEPILAKTMGVPIFQEQIMQMASTVAGFTPGEADELRRIMSSSWKRKDVMEGVRKRLISGMLSHGISMKYAQQIYQTIEGFASYGFPESHAASFALLTYASCYLKKHHPDLFLCSLLNSQPMGFYSPRNLIREAQRQGVQLRDLDVQASEYDYIIEPPFYSNNEGQSFLYVRQGFRCLKGFRQKYAQAIVQTRQQQGAFKDLRDFVQRTHLPKQALMTLGAAGAFREFGLEPRSALWKIQALHLDQQSLFFGQSKEHWEAPSSQIDDSTSLLPKENDWETMQREYRTSGYSLHLHPIQILRPTLNKWSQLYQKNNSIGFSHSNDLKTLPHGHKIRVAGLIGIHQRPPTAKGTSFITLEDEFGFFNLILDKQTYQQHRLLLTSSTFLEVVGRLEKNQEVTNIKVTHLRNLPSEAAHGL